MSDSKYVVPPLHKGRFLIRMLDKESDKLFEWREGWITNDNIYGFYRIFDGCWSITDIATGMGYGFGETRKECIEKINSNPNKYNSVRNTNLYQTAAAALRKYKEENNID